MESQRVGTGLGEMITLGKHHCLPYDDNIDTSNKPKSSNTKC